jgi:hypothetical protein
LKPLPKYELKVGTDLNYSQILNLGVSPSVDLTTRNVFRGAENLSTSLSGTLDLLQVQNIDKRIWHMKYQPRLLKFSKIIIAF